MICPQCKAEYRPGFTRCADCDLDLVAAPPGSAPALEAFLSDREQRDPLPSDTGDPNEDPFCSFWKGTSARVCTELCTVLEEAGIPHKTIHREDHLFNLASTVPYEVGVPASLYEKAEAAVKEAFGSDEQTDEDAMLLPAPDSDRAAFGKRLAEAISDANEWLGQRYPEDATVLVWSGDEPDIREMIEMSLEENDMMSRSEEDAGQAKVFVLPEDEARAKEIVREIVNGEPPQ
jgi:hypothetical protein